MSRRRDTITRGMNQCPKDLFASKGIHGLCNLAIIYTYIKVFNLFERCIRNEYHFIRAIYDIISYTYKYVAQILVFMHGEVRIGQS